MPVKAGPRVVGITFVRKSGALVESVREPFFTTHAEGGTRSQPSVASVTIAGPFSPTGVSETPSRQRIFACKPANRQAEAACARQVMSQLARRAYRRPATDAQLKELLEFYTEGRATGTFENGIELALRRLLVSPEFLYRIEADPSGVSAGLHVRARRLRARVAAVVLPVEQHPRRAAARRGSARRAQESSRSSPVRCAA